jgi:hypothetical protein
VSDQHGAAYENRHPAQRIEARGRIAESAYEDGGREGLGAKGGEQRQDERERPGDPELCHQMGREGRQQVDPPAPHRRDQERGGQDCGGRPEER